MLSPKELFKYRTALEQAMPPRGGAKDFMPDGSWLQEKCIENFHQERERAISEPRVFRSKDLVKGEWKPEVGLVELFHEMKNFWEHMGFNDKKRKWLHPEEALFLMETNILEIWYEGIPMSFQEAYTSFTGHIIQLEFYQVYSYLRRVGYVVLRHQGRYDYTKYEQQIGIDKVKGKKNKNKGGKSKQSKTDKADPSLKTDKTDGSPDTVGLTDNYGVNEQLMGSEPAESDNNIGIEAIVDSVKAVKDNRDHCQEKAEASEEVVTCNMDVEETGEAPVDSIKAIRDNRDHCQEKTEAFEEVVTCDMDVEETERAHGDSKDICEPVNAVSNDINNETRQVPRDSNKNSEPINAVASSINTRSESKSMTHESERRTKYTYSSWNFDEIVFPNFISGEQVVSIHKPNADYIPQGSKLEFCYESYDYEKCKFINTKKEKKKLLQRDKEAEKELEFSHADIMTGWQKVKKTCRNWAEYKQAKIKEKQAWNRAENFPNLYKDKVEPLVKPELARSTHSVLNQLQIINDYTPSSTKNDKVPETMPDFDVYAPNTKFKKSTPGIPDFRVKVVRSNEPVPDISTLTAIQTYLNDDVPLQWSVVDSGNISFYNMSDFTLPIDISLG